MRKATLACFGLGFSPFAPGTLTSAVTTTLIYLTGGVVQPIPQLLLLVFSATLLFLLYHPSDGEDPRWVTLDEVAGQSLALLPFLNGVALSFRFCAISFVSFRLLDILKPPPISQSQRIRGAVGILMDDILAGGVSCALCNFLIKLG